MPGFELQYALKVSSTFPPFPRKGEPYLAVAGSNLGLSTQGSRAEANDRSRDTGGEADDEDDRSTAPPWGNDMVFFTVVFNGLMQRLPVSAVLSTEGRLLPPVPMPRALAQVEPLFVGEGLLMLFLDGLGRRAIEDGAIEEGVLFISTGLFFIGLLLLLQGLEARPPPSVLRAVRTGVSGARNFEQCSSCNRTMSVFVLFKTGPPDF